MVEFTTSARTEQIYYFFPQFCKAHLSHTPAPVIYYWLFQGGTFVMARFVNISSVFYLQTVFF